MADPSHIEILRKGVPNWNDMRDQKPNFIPDLSGTNLRAADLREANLGKADLRAAKLGGAKLGGTNLGFADLRGSMN